MGSHFLGFPDANFDSGCGASKCCCASRIAGTLLERQLTAALEAYSLVSLRKEESRSMRIHIDRKPLDGNAIAFVLIMLLIAVAFAY
jgi:hypothetical protein